MNDFKRRNLLSPLVCLPDYIRYTCRSPASAVRPTSLHRTPPTLSASARKKTIILYKEHHKIMKETSSQIPSSMLTFIYLFRVGHSSSTLQEQNEIPFAQLTKHGR